MKPLTHSGDVFTPRRFFLLTMNTLRLGLRSIVITAAIIVGAEFLLLILRNSSNSLGNPHQSLYPLYLFLAGISATGHAHAELRRPESAARWLTLPASVFEKFLSRLFLTSFGLVALTLAAYVVVSGALEFFVALFFPGPVHWFNPFTQDIFDWATLYVVLQAPFFVGSAYFRDKPFTRTLGVLILVFVILFFFALAVARIVLWDFFDGFFPDVAEILRFLRSFHAGVFSEQMGRIGQVVAWGLRMAFWFVLAPLCWAAAYYRLKETEVA
ncbi:MAG: hypothetical protein ACLFOY_00660 [Desulfatibacillaceae bacterium]